MTLLWLIASHSSSIKVKPKDNKNVNRTKLNILYILLKNIEGIPITQCT